MEKYTFFADYYDVLTENVDYESRADYFLEILKKHNHEPKEVLDLACGTGSFTIELKKRNIDVFGIDGSVDMLTAAKDKSYENNLNIMFYCQTMENLTLPQKINTCFCTLDSINHIVNKKDLIKAFSNIGKYLADDGLFVFDVNTVYKHKNILGDNCYIYDLEEVFCAWHNDYREKTNKVVITLDFFEPQGKLYSRYTEQFEERAYTHEEMADMLKEAGLETIALYNDMTFDKPDENSEREIYVVRKII